MGPRSRRFQFYHICTPEKTRTFPFFCKPFATAEKAENILFRRELFSRRFHLINRERYQEFFWFGRLKL